MKTKQLFALTLVVLSLLFVACDDTDDGKKDVELTGIYINNYGSYSGAKTTFTAFDVDSLITEQGAFESQNGYRLSSNIQHALYYKGKIYATGNNKDILIEMNADDLSETTSDTVSVVKPRFSVAKGDYLYISCWANADWNIMADSYIAKYNTKTKTVEKMIALPGGPEGLAIANGKLYAALNYRDSVSVIDLSSDEVIKHIITPAVTSYFVTDKDDNLYVSLVSTYSDKSTETGLGFINTTTDMLEVHYKLANVSASSASILAYDDDNNKIYVTAASYNEAWEMVGNISVFNSETKEFEGELLEESIMGIQGVSLNPETEQIYVLVSTGTSTAGACYIYNEDGTFVKQVETGISPNWTLFVD